MDDVSHEQVARLDGPYAARTAAIGAVAIAMAFVVVWLVREEPWPSVSGAALVFVPLAVLGAGIVWIAFSLHARRAVWRLRADARGVSLTIEGSDGRCLKRESIAREQMAALSWVEGDADLSAGVRIAAHAGRGLFIPAASFDVDAFRAFALRHYDGLVSTPP